MNIEWQSSQDYEEVNYGSSLLEEVYQQDNNKDFDWDQDCFIYD